MGVMTVALTDDFDPEIPVFEAIQTGDRYAFDEFVRRQHRWVHGVVFGVLGDRDRCEDVVQQAWLAIWTQANKLRDTRRWRPWVYRLVRNAAIDAGRDITRRRQRSGPMPFEVIQNGQQSVGPADAMRDEQHQQVLGAIKELPALYREPFVLRHLNGWSYREIAEVMAMPVDSIETRLVRARRLLRDSLKSKVR